MTPRGKTKIATGPQATAGTRASTVMKLGLAAFALAALVALIKDLQTISHPPAGRMRTPQKEIQQLKQGLSAPRYIAANRRFSLVPPAGWQILTPPKSEAYDVIFRSNCGAELRIMTRQVTYSDFDSLVKEVKKSQKKFGIYPTMQPVNFQGMTALRREARLYGSQIMTLDFVSGGIEHHILFSCPPNLFSNYLPAIESLLKTYRAAPDIQ